MTPAVPPAAAPPAARRAGRGRYWAGFAIGFALLALASCGGLAIAFGFDDLSLAQLRGNSAQAWVPPTLEPTPTVDPNAPAVVEEEPIDGRFAAGQTVFNVTASRVNVRRTPGHLGKEANDVLAQMDAGDPAEILGETAQADNLTWWRVAYQGNEGWVAEATASGVQILGAR